MRTTCWARGGVCIDIRDCPDLNIDVNVPGCNRGYKVCCKIAKVLPPTVGIKRTSNNAYSAEDFDDHSINIAAQENAEILKLY